MRNILFVYGIDDTDKVIVRTVTPTGAAYVLRGNIDIVQDLIDPRIAIQRTLLGGVAPQAQPLPQNTALVFNCIADADTNQRTLTEATALLAKLRVPVLNPPSRVLETRRDQVAEKLQGIPGLVMPVPVRIQPKTRREILAALELGPVRYPAIVRSTGTHGGQTMALLRSPADADLLDQFACDGSELYLIPFVDYRSADGLYRKIRIVMVEGQPHARHMLAHTDWKVHARARQETMRGRADLKAQEAEFLDNFATHTLPLWRDRLAAIHARLGLDYAIIDCSALPNGDLLVFEANAGGNTLRNGNPQEFPYLPPHVARLRESVFRMLLRPR